MHKAIQIIFLLFAVSAVPYSAFAHCDSVQGPVIADARLAFKQGQVTPVLKWVKPSDEPAVREAFARALAVRAKGDEARELAEHYFFETLVRLHRAGEGAPYTGLKAASIDPVIAAVDRSVTSGDGDELIEKTLQHIRAELRQKLDRATAARKTSDTSVEAGREYVEAYVELVHYVELLHGGHAAEDASEKEAAVHRD